MLHYQLLSNVEQTFSLLEFCVLVNLRIRQLIRPKMDGVFHRRRHEHSPYQYICFCMLALRKFRRLLTFPISFAETENLAHVLMVRVFHVPQFWCTRRKFLVLLGLECFLSSLCVWLISELESARILFPAALTTSFLSSIFLGLTRDPKLCEDAHHQIDEVDGSRLCQYHKLWFCLWRAST